MTPYPTVARILRRRAREVEAIFPRIAELTARADYTAGRAGRQFAYCEASPVCVVFSPRLEGEPTHRIEGIVRHELAHAIDYLYARSTIERRLGVQLDGVPPEHRADAIAGALWREPILYDAEAVQSVKEGSPVRPSRLPR